MTAGPTTYWAEHAWLPTGLATGVRFDVTDGHFAAVHRHARAEAGDVRLHGVVLPGLANAHSHAFHRALRGRTHGDGGNFWTWRQQMYAVTRHLTPDTYFALARAVFAEMVLSGTTVVGEFHYLHHDVSGRPYADPNAMGTALVEAAKEAGLRLTLLDTCYLAGGLSGDGHLPLDEVQRRFTDGDVDRWAARVAALSPDATTRIGSAVHSVRAVPRDALRAMAEVTRGRTVHAHVSEQPAENLATQMYYGATPTELLDEAGLLGERFSAVHATHLSDHDIELLGGSASTACFCPTTERDLADGIGPARALVEAGARISLGSDQHAVIDPFEEVRGLEMHERLASNERGRFTPDELMTAASVDGYRSLGWSDAGTIADGSAADFVVVRTDTVNTTGAKAGQILYSATRSDVDTVVVGGQAVVESGRHRLGDVAALLGRALADVRDHQ
ncbi:formiminoglutamate deiminase [Pedococcus dokdonensis]|uniref:Formiminoglutamate deiminase n=1 Tax=Pedococcus dokdonensis TaxID=443156 RepID=A0A1H0T811_9MICO|nr:formimidoylglutamate deiminase [Pedococcus dokdonensis]SDP50193.1 formiminoglutamate deiminase [Pedococcus dokdonensis]